MDSLLPTSIPHVPLLPTDAFFPDCRSAAGMAFPLIVQLTTNEETLIPVVSSYESTVVFRLV